MNNKMPLINKLGLLGVAALLSYTAAVIFAPLAYPGYSSLSQAVSDLSAENSPSRLLWQQLSAVYDLCTVSCVTLVSVYIQGRLNKPLRLGIWLFSLMSWISGIGYKMFPLSQSGNGGSARDKMHIYVVTPIVVLLSIASLTLIIIGGVKDKKYKWLAVCAGICLALMFAGAVGTGALPKQYFGIPERFSVFAAAGFTAVLGVFLFTQGKQQKPQCQ
ncbi:MAG: DUF998 domain-containing protein [Ruminococcus sp.]|nr:DUF998 domain-containing protein [Ruminococcus sp.]